MSAPPAVTAHILRNFSIVFIGIVGNVVSGTEVYNIASRKDREFTKAWGEERPYNTQLEPQQDRLYEPSRNLKHALLLRSDISEQRYSLRWDPTTE
jgi:hypothetical protein